jgi:hypothetical protein
LLRLNTVIVPVENMSVINDRMRYSSEEEEELHLRSGLTGVEGEAGGLEVGGEGESGEVGICALIESMGVSELLDVCTSIESTGMSEFLNAASVVEKFAVFAFLTLLHVVREVLTEGWQDRV